MKLFLSIEVDDRFRRLAAKARKMETTQEGLATRQALLAEFRAVVDAHCDDLASDGERADE